MGEYRLHGYNGDVGKLSGAGAQDVFMKIKKAEDELKCSASEVLSAYPVLRLFVSKLLTTQPGLPREIVAALQCFLLHCEVLDVLALASRDNGATVVNRLRRCIVTHLTAFLATHGENQLPPKGHFAIHLPTMLEHHGQLVSCWVHERRHKELKRFANNLHKATAGSERSLMRDMLLSHLEDLDEYDMVIPVGLRQPRRAGIDIQNHFALAMGLPVMDLMASARAYFAPNRWASTGDKVLLEEPPTVAEIVYHCKADQHLLTCVRLGTKVAQNRFSMTHDMTFVLTENIQGVCIWREEPDGCYTVAPQIFAD